MLIDLRPDDTAAPRKGYKPLARVPATEGDPYDIERRAGGVIRLARRQRTGTVVSLIFSPVDARRVAAALLAAADQLEGENKNG